MQIPQKAPSFIHQINKTNNLNYYGVVEFYNLKGIFANLIKNKRLFDHNLE
jgi:hypothetical protein